ncbi:MAG: glycine--tRNA ligase subunit beta [Anaerolineae bacterium]|nr:glycine--tRNA ligase subunit beta [Anaerolineae bacterium]
MTVFSPYTHQPLSFQDVIIRLQSYWAGQGCLIWQPYYAQVGAGTMNPATYLRVLGPEPWNVGYVEPSVRPDDGRYGDNPNRMQLHYQYQVILKPDPGNPQELYLQSLEAIGIDRRWHDIRFVEDNWESPALGAWGLGWEVWLNGQEITQFTYFQQAGGQVLNPVSVEITYGLERILIALQGVNSVWEIDWGNGYRYGDALLQSEIEHCRYYFEVADVEALTEVFNTYENEARNALAQEPPLVLPAHDYVLKCSHLFNVLDTRGAIGVVERAQYFSRMQALAAGVAQAYTEQRKRLEYPTLPPDWEVDAETQALTVPSMTAPEVLTDKFPTRPAPFVLEIGVEELPAADLDSALAQLDELVPAMLSEARLAYRSVAIGGTPRRLVVYIEGLSPNQKADERIVRGPPSKVAFDAKGKPTKAAEGFARKNGVPVDALERQEIEGGEYVVAVVKYEGRPTPEVLAELLPELIAAIRFDKAMRWNFSGIAFSRPLRWLVALFDKAVVSFSYADVYSGRTTRGTRPEGSPETDIDNAAAYFDVMAAQCILSNPAVRRTEIDQQIRALAKQAGGVLKEDPALLDEVTNLVEQPTALLGKFEQEFLELPEPVLTTVMKKHQRYFAVVDKKGKLLPVFIAVRNGNGEHLATVIDGNEHVIRARFADARFFYTEDTRRPLAGFLPDLKTLTFQEALGSYYDKSSRLEGVAARLGSLLGLSDDELDVAIRAARLAKADLTTQMVVELTSLQGIMGREYALRSGEQPAVAQAIAEHYQPRQSGDRLPESPAGITVALADRVDSLVGLLAVGLAPTSSADPYGLRRAALGLVQILLGHGISLDLRQVLKWSAKSQPVDVDEETLTAVVDFIAGRLRGVLRETYQHDVVEAVLGALAHDPCRAGIHAEQLAAQVARPDWPPILDAYARCVRITRDQKEQFKLKPKSFTEPAEKNLLAAYKKASKVIDADADVDTFIEAFEKLVEPISVFFAPAAEGGVLVMDKDLKVRQNRLALLQHIVALGAGVADFSQLEGF